MQYHPKAGWADALQPGDTVIVDNGYGHTADTRYRTAKVESVTKTEVRVEGRAYRRGRGRSQWVTYQNEGREIATLNSSYGKTIFPNIREVKNEVRRHRDYDRRQRLIRDTHKALIAAAEQALHGEQLKKLEAALAALGGSLDDAR